jgi:hypothetical protein
LSITAAPFGPQWLKSDYPEDIAITWDEQVLKAKDCYNAGATLLHVHVRDPKTGHVSTSYAPVNTPALDDLFDFFNFGHSGFPGHQIAITAAQ